MSREVSSAYPRRRSELLSTSSRFFRQWGFGLFIIGMIVLFRDVLRGVRPAEGT